MTTFGRANDQARPLLTAFPCTLHPAPCLGVLETTLPVVQADRGVRIDREAIERLADDLARRPLPTSAWRVFPHWWGEPEASAQYALVLDALNFCFWGDPKWRVEYAGQVFDGYWALAACLRRAIEAGTPILDARWLAACDEPAVRQLLAGSGELLLVPERAASLHQAGAWLLRDWEGQFHRAVDACGRSAVRVAQLVAAELPSFDDRTTYDGAEVRLFKRAQILASDLFGVCAGTGPGALDDLEALTAFADYKLPQVLRELGALEYASDLATRVDGLEELPSEGPEEVEIRAATIWAVEWLREALAARGRAVPAYQLDWYLWELGQEARWKHPYHRTRTVYY